MNELYRMLRPTDYDGVFGQDGAIAQLKRFDEKGQYPHAMLFIGPSGVGKTTLIRIIKTKLECSRANYQEINAASDRGIDMIRTIQDQCRQQPLFMGNRVWALDEFHAATSDAQDSALKMLEDIGERDYFMLATTKADKIKDTIKTRCTKIVLKAVAANHMMSLLKMVGTLHPPANVSDKVQERIVAVADGSPRAALVLLNQIMGMATEQEQLDAAQKTSTKEDAFRIVKALLWERPKWVDVAAILLKIEDEPEMLRRLVLACAKTELLKATKNAPRAFKIITAFEGSPWASDQSGMASLCRACYEVILP